MSRGVSSRVNEVVDHEWAKSLVRGWTEAGWMDLPSRLGDRVAPLIGARRVRSLVADTLTIAAGQTHRRGASSCGPIATCVLTDALNFHSDLYIVEAMANYAGRPITVKAIERSSLDDALSDDVALVMLTHVDFRNGEMLDLTGITQKVHDAGALMLWDFAHSTGAVPLDVEERPGGLRGGLWVQVPERGPGRTGLHVRTCLAGRASWRILCRAGSGTRVPSTSSRSYEPAKGMQAFVTSSPSIIALCCPRWGPGRLRPDVHGVPYGPRACISRTSSWNWWKPRCPASSRS